MKRIILTLILALGCAASQAQSVQGNVIRITNIGIELKGGFVELRFTAEMGSEAAGSKYMLTLVPEFADGRARCPFTKINIRGRRAQKKFERRGNDSAAGYAVAMPDAYDATNGGQVIYTATVPYASWMKGCELRLRGTHRAKAYAVRTDLGTIARGLEIFEEVLLVYPDKTVPVPEN